MGLWEPPETGSGNRFIPDHLDFRGRPQMLARLPGGGGPTLLLNGHIDAVDVEPRAQWSSDPFTPEVRDGRLYGRGTADMKGFLACVLAAVPDYVQRRLTVPIHLAFSYDEEIGCLGVRPMLAAVSYTHLTLPTNREV